MCQVILGGVSVNAFCVYKNKKNIFKLAKFLFKIKKMYLNWQNLNFKY
jgi:hypothetical protein